MLETLSTPASFETSAPMERVTLSVLVRGEPSGSCMVEKTTPWSSSGINDEGIVLPRTQQPAIISAKMPKVTSVRRASHTEPAT